MHKYSPLWVWRRNWADFALRLTKSPQFHLQLIPKAFNFKILGLLVYNIGVMRNKIDFRKEQTWPVELETYSDSNEQGQEATPKIQEEMTIKNPRQEGKQQGVKQQWARVHMKKGKEEATTETCLVAVWSTFAISAYCVRPRRISHTQLARCRRWADPPGRHYACDHSLDLDDTETNGHERAIALS